MDSLTFDSFIHLAGKIILYEDKKKLGIISGGYVIGNFRKSNDVRIKRNIIAKVMSKRANIFTALRSEVKKAIIKQPALKEILQPDV